MVIIVLRALALQAGFGHAKTKNIERRTHMCLFTFLVVLVSALGKVVLKHTVRKEKPEWK